MAFCLEVISMRWDNLVLRVDENSYLELNRQLLDDAEKEKPMGVYKVDDNKAVLVGYIRINWYFTV
jgi:hypothetical protein